MAALVGVACESTNASASSTAPFAETPKEIIAAQIRMQGFACDKPVSAERDLRRSRNEAVWLLKCDILSYQVRLVPNMAADVRPMD